MFKHLALPVLLSFFVSAAIAGPPERIDRAQGGPPIWISAHAAVDDKGEPRSGALDPGSEAAYRQFIAQQKGRHGVDRCGGLSLFQTDSIASHGEPNATAADLVRHARLIVDGTLGEAVPGFLYGAPGTLYRLQLDHVLRSGDGIPASGGEVWFFFPYARIPFAGGTLCVDVPKVRPPQSGRRVLLFDYLAPMGPDHNVIAVDASNELVVEEQGGTAQVPASLRTLGSTFDELNAAVTKLVQAEANANH